MRRGSLTKNGAEEPEGALEVGSTANFTYGESAFLAGGGLARLRRAGFVMEPEKT